MEETDKPQQTSELDRNDLQDKIISVHKEHPEWTQPIIAKHLGISVGKLIREKAKIKRLELEAKIPGDGQSILSNSAIKSLLPIAIKRNKAALFAQKTVMDKNGVEHTQDDWTAQLNAVEKIYNLNKLYPDKTTNVKHTHKEVTQLKEIFEKRRIKLKMVG